MRLMVSMGLRPDGRPRTPLAAHLVELDLSTGRARRTLRHVTPLHWRSGPDADQEMTCAAPLDADTLLQPTLTEVLWVDTRHLSVVHVMSHPELHSVHSAVPRPGGGVTVTCAGTDSVLELSESGELLAAHRLGGDRPMVDHRRAHHDAYKPHAVHPNHAIHHAGSVWITGFESRACTALNGQTIELGGIPHDGRLREGRLWFTRVDGHVLGVNAHSYEVEVHIDLRAMSGTERMLGWCRGVDVLGDRLYVGMTMLRRTAHREVARMLLRGEAGRKLPTRVLEIDLVERRIVREIPLGNQAGGTIYGLNLVR